MNFNGMSWFQGPNINTTSNLTVFAVVMLSGNAANNSRIVSLATPTKVDYSTYAEVLALQQPGNSTAIGTGRNTQPPTGGTYNLVESFDTSTTSNVPYIAVARYSASSTQTLFVNGTAKATAATTGAFGYTSYGIGNYANAPSASEPFTGKISEVLIYSNALTPVQRAQVENYLYQKWAINVSSTALTHAVPYNTCNVTANYNQVGSYISYTVTTPADETGATNAGRSYIYSVVPSWNGTNGNAVYTDTQSPIRLFKPTTPGGLAATGQGNSFTLTWQSAVIWTSPATIIPSYLLQVGPTTVSGSYPTQSFNVIGNTQTVNGFDSSAGTLTISLTAVTPVGYTNPIYGNPATLTFTVPSGTSVSITQSTINAETLIVTVPVQLVGAQRTWFFITGTGQGGANTQVVSNVQTYKTTSSNYDVNVSLGYNYTISAAITTSTTLPPTPADPSAPANANPFPAKTFNVSGITVTHDACTVTLNWLAVTGAAKYYVQTNNNGQPASGKFGQEYTTTTATITNNGGSPTEQFAANAIYSYIVRAFTLSTNQFQGSSVRSCNILSDIATSANVQMYIPTNPTVAQLILTQSFANIIASWPALDSYPKDNAADIGTPSYTISCQPFASSITTTGTTATFVGITPGTAYQISLNTRYKGFFGATPTTTTFQTTAPTITSGPTLTNTGTAQIRVTASAATVGFWYLVDGTTETPMNSPQTVSSNQITSNFPAEKATSYTRRVKFVTQDTGLSVSAQTNTVITPNLVVGASIPVAAAGDRAFSITLSCASGTPEGSVAWQVGTPTGTTFLSGNTSISATMLTYQFTNAAWSTNLSATFTSIVLSNNGFTFPYTIASSTTTEYTTPTPTAVNITNGATGSTIIVTVIGGGGGGGGGIGRGGGRGGNGAVATYTFTGIAIGTPITYFVGNSGVGGAGAGGSGGGGSNSYVTIGSTKIYAGGGGGGGGAVQVGGSGTNGIGDGAGGGGVVGTNGDSGTIPTTAMNGERLYFYGSGVNGVGLYFYGIGGNQVGTEGVRGAVVITQIPAPTYTPPNLNIPTPTLANSAGRLVLAASTTGGCNVNWTWPSYNSVAGTGITPSSTLTVTYGNLGNTGTNFTAGGALSLAFNGYTNSVAQTSLPTFKAPTFSISSVTFADPQLPTQEYISPTNTDCNVPGGAASSTVVVTVIGGGGGGGGFRSGEIGGNGGVATYTFTNVTPTTPITYFVGRGGSLTTGTPPTANRAAGGGNNSYVTIGSTTIYAGGGGGGAFADVGYSGCNGVGQYAGTGATLFAQTGGNGGISPNASAGIGVGTYGIGGTISGGTGNNGIVVISFGGATRIIRLTASYGTYDAGTTGGTTTPQWTLPSTTSNGGGYTQLSTTGTLTPTTSPATLDYSTTQNGSNYAIAANVISLSYQGISISYGSLLTASSPTVAINTPVPVTYDGIFATLTPTSIGNLLGNWTVSSAVSGLVGPVNYVYLISPRLTGNNSLITGDITSINSVGGSWSQVNTLVAGANGIQGDRFIAGQTATYSNGATIPATFQFLMYIKPHAQGDSDTLGYLNFATSGGNYSIVTSYNKPLGGNGPTDVKTVIQNPTGTILATLSSTSYQNVNPTVVIALYFQVVRTANSLSFYSSEVSLNAAIASTPNVYSGFTTVDKLVLGFNTNQAGNAAEVYVKNFSVIGTPSTINNVSTTALTYYADPQSYTPFTIPLQFSYGGFTSSVVNTTISFSTIVGTAPITGATFLYASTADNTPNGFNVTYTVAGFTPTSVTPASIGCTTPVTLDTNYNNFSPRILVTTATNTANIQKGTLTNNVLYQVNAAASFNAALGSLRTRNVVMPGAVSDIKWGSAAGSSNNQLATSNTIWISWTPISPDTSIASRFTYTLYSNTGVVNRPSTTSPTGAVTGYTGLAVGTSNVQFTISVSGSQTYFIGTTYTDPSGYSYYGAASTSIKFTYGSSNIPANIETQFTQANANTYLVAKIGSGNGGTGYPGLGGGSGGYGGAAASYTYDGNATNILKSGYRISLVPGDDGQGSQGGAGQREQGGSGGTGVFNGNSGFAGETAAGGGGGGGGSARMQILSDGYVTKLLIMLIGGSGGGGGGGVFNSVNKTGGVGGLGGAAPVFSGGAGGIGNGASTRNGSNGSAGSLASGSTTGIGSIGNARPATSTCDIYYVVPNI